MGKCRKMSLPVKHFQCLMGGHVDHFLPPKIDEICCRIPMVVWKCLQGWFVVIIYFKAFGFFPPPKPAPSHVIFLVSTYFKKVPRLVNQHLPVHLWQARIISRQLNKHAFETLECLVLSFLGCCC